MYANDSRGSSTDRCARRRAVESRMKSKTKLVRVGCCGFRSAMVDYVQHFRVVEVQQTFYQPPQISTLERWRKEAPHDFEFTLKAWQLITHKSKSPTYKRLKKKLSDTER